MAKKDLPLEPKHGWLVLPQEDLLHAEAALSHPLAGTQAHSAVVK